MIAKSEGATNYSKFHRFSLPKNKCKHLNLILKNENSRKNKITYIINNKHHEKVFVNQFCFGCYECLYAKIMPYILTIRYDKC